MLVPWPLQPQPIKLFVAICALAEMLALAGQMAGFGQDMRALLIGFGGFWPELLHGATPAYPGQSVLMFATAVFLHGGLLHLFMNMVAMLWLGPMVTQRLGDRAFWPIAGLTALGSGWVFTLLATSGTPMVGASGVAFGVLGTVACWEVLDRRARAQSLMPLLRPAGMFLLLNILLMLMSGGTIAWQAHLGGFLAGAACGLLTWRRPGVLRWS